PVEKHGDRLECRLRGQCLGRRPAHGGAKALALDKLGEQRRRFLAVFDDQHGAARRAGHTGSSWLAGAVSASLNLASSSASMNGFWRSLAPSGRGMAEPMTGCAWPDMKSTRRSGCMVLSSR